MNESYIVIEPFMLKYKLPQTELLCYAIIHSFSKQQQGCFFGTQRYLSDQIKTSRQAVNQALTSLESKGLVTKEIVSSGRLEYSTLVEGVQPQLTEEGATTVDKGATTVAGGATTVDKGATTVAHIIKYNKNIIKYNKNIIKYNKNKETFDILINSYTTCPNLKNSLIEFIKMRKLIGKPMTNQALKLILKKIDDYTSRDDEKIKILNYSIEGSYPNIYPLTKKLVEKSYSSDDVNALFDKLAPEDM